MTPLLLLSQPTLGDGLTAKERVQAILQGELSYVLTPTVYFLPTMVQDLSLCRFTSRKMIEPNGKVLVTVCPEQHDQCLLQGTCKIVKGKESITLHFNSRVKGVAFFNQVQLDECPFGFGVRESLCLDPYFSVAADLSFYRPGDVIYVPAVRGLILADGRIHNGYFIVRDTGGAIKGLGRFDFFIGEDDPRDPKNPFLQLKLADKKTRLAFQVVRGELAERVKKSRLFPSVQR